MRHLSRVIFLTERQIRRFRACIYEAQFSFNDLKNANYSTNADNKSSSHKYKTKVALAFGTAFAAYGLYYYIGAGKKQNIISASPRKNDGAGKYKPDLPTYTPDEVAAHNDMKTGVWVMYGEGVYNITDFVDNHPGGRQHILMAAGGSMDPFWMIYGFHKTPAIFELLEEFRIGNVDKIQASESTSNMVDPYGNDPRRHPALKPSSEKPFNAEPPLSLLVESFITPTDLFYVRNHLPVPEVDEKTYELEVTGVGVENKTFKLDDIKKFPKYTLNAALQCAGNRRSEMTEVKPVKGLSWGPAAIGNATWSGAKLKDVLVAAGWKENGKTAEHVQFEGLDLDTTSNPYGASIPIEKALSPDGDVLLAYEMNGEPISRDHGFPIRVIVPGTVGARNVKWLGRIIISEEESKSHWQQNDYKGFSPSTDWDTVDFSTAQAIQELPVVSAICDPIDGAKVQLEDGKLVVRGYAWSGGGRKIIRVDVTADEGKSWHVAKFTDQDTKAKVPRHWAWTLWKVEIPVPPKTEKVEIWAKAVDSSYNVQPEKFENIWNLRGVLGNAYHRIKVNIDQ